MENAFLRRKPRQACGAFTVKKRTEPIAKRNRLYRSANAIGRRRFITPKRHGFLCRGGSRYRQRKRQTAQYIQGNTPFGYEGLIISPLNALDYPIKKISCQASKTRKRIDGGASYCRRFSRTSPDVPLPGAPQRPAASITARQFSIFSRKSFGT